MTQSLESGYQISCVEGGSQKTYHIEKTLGRGGFGITYLATAEELVGNIPQITRYTIKEFCISDICTRQKDGSITVPERDREEFESSKTDFLHEAERLHAMHQENIVPVNEVFEANGTAYYVMQYLGEKSLVKYVKEMGGSLSEDEAVPIAIAIGNALEYLHNQKVTHLDVKPENVMMLQRHKGGLTPVLIDFGLACHYKKNGSSTSKHSATGITDGYSPLEQYAGIERFSPEADIYALGATLYFMLTGKAPLKAADMSAQYLYKTLPDGLSDEVVETLRKSMEKMAERRIKSVAQFKKMLALEDVIPEGGKVTVRRKKTTPHVSPIGNGNLLKYGLMGMGAIIVLLLAILLIPSGKDKPVTEPLPPPADTTVVVPTETNNPSATNVQQSKEQERPQQTQGQAVQTPPPSTQPAASNSSGNTSAPAGQNAATQENSQRNYVDLGYAEWRGPVKNGKPNGDGTMTFKTSHRIESRDPAGNIAEAGDYIRGTYVNGHLDQGTWHKSSGGSEFLMIGQ